MDSFGLPVFDVLEFDPPDLRTRFLQNNATWTPELLQGNFTPDLNPEEQGEEIRIHGLAVEQKLQDLATNHGFKRFRVGDYVKTEQETRVGKIDTIVGGRIYVSMHPVNFNAPVNNFNNPINYRLAGEPIWSRYFEDGRPFPNTTDMGVSYLVLNKNSGKFYDPTLHINALPHLFGGAANQQEIDNAQQFFENIVGNGPAGAAHEEIPAADVHALANAIAGIQPMADLQDA